jgi:hypothetical protein
MMWPEQIVDTALTVIEHAIEEMLYQWSIQPVYTVKDVLKGTAFKPRALIGVGGGAPGIGSLSGQTDASAGTGTLRGRWSLTLSGQLWPVPH